MSDRFSYRNNDCGPKLLAGRADWREGPPTCPGFYWVRRARMAPAIVRLVPFDDFRGRGLLVIAGGSRPLSEFKAESWCGPLLPPDGAP
jgi:hypothetical protein